MTNPSEEKEARELLARWTSGELVAGERSNYGRTALLQVEAAVRTLLAAPISMLLFCPNCGVQHVDADERTPGWTNPPHRSHLCHACGCIWRPADVPTEGVEAIATRGQADTWAAHSWVQRPASTRPTPSGDGLVEVLRKVDQWLLTVPPPGTEGATWLLGEVRQALAHHQSPASRGSAEP